uniref:GTD-binding domain-containing protein n=1 Tax=Ananas comosus var. bracteatus TaxID=296719 RepID=A0A6V7Q3N1_ANACO|nr:unnamed protein product [Ananas comosus var. bracteatus]
MPIGGCFKVNCKFKKQEIVVDDGCQQIRDDPAPAHQPDGSHPRVHLPGVGADRAPSAQRILRLPHRQIRRLLRPPPTCVFCSRVDRLFSSSSSSSSSSSFRAAICDGHAAELSRLGFCADHRRLADAAEMCEDCCAAADRLSWMRRSEAGEPDLRCSCCGVPLESGFYSPPYLLSKPSPLPLDSPPVDDSALDRENSSTNARFAVEDEPGAQNFLVFEFSDESSPTPLADDSAEAMTATIRCEENATDADRLVALEVIDEMTVMEKPVVFKIGGGEDRDMDRDREEHDARALDIGVVLEEKMVLDSSVERADCFEESGALAAEEDILEPHDRVELKVESSTAEEEIVEPHELMSVEDSVEFKVEALEDEEEIVEPHDCVELKVEASTAEEEIVEPHELMSVEDSVEFKVEALEDEEEIVEPHDCVILKVEASTAEEEIVELELHDCVEPEVESSTAEQEIVEPLNSVEFKEVSAAEEEIDEPQYVVEFKEEEIDEPQYVVEFKEEEIDEPQYIVEFKEEALTAEQEIVEPQNNAELKEEESATEEEIAEPEAFEEDAKVDDIDVNCEISIGSEICDEEKVEQVEFQEPISPAFGVEDRSIEASNETSDIDQAIESELVSLRAKRIRAESLDGSVASDIEGTEPLTIDSLKSALKAERKALGVLYAELEEERSAAAVAANQTMAMITRLQEEKAAMQMEASHYQRMMDEQSEYDQEALHVLNELLTKRDKEKQGLERELEVYRQRVLHYEAKEKKKLARHKANGTNGASSPSSSGEESDDFSFDYFERNESSYSVNEKNQNTPTDAVLSSPREIESAKLLIKRKASVADFDEEKLSILERLRVLEDRLFELEDGESCEVNHHESNDEDYKSLSDVLHGSLNGYSDSLGNSGKHLHSEGRNMNAAGKRLLPLFDAVSMENEVALASIKEEAQEAGNSPKLASNSAKEQERLVFGEEVDDVYERLQALEADREFLKHCIKSLKKGDKGMDLLKEILHHLRELRSVELRGGMTGIELFLCYNPNKAWLIGSPLVVWSRCERSEGFDQTRVHIEEGGKEPLVLSSLIFVGWSYHMSSGSRPWKGMDEPKKGSGSSIHDFSLEMFGHACTSATSPRHVEHHHIASVVHFTADDNAYVLQFFEGSAASKGKRAGGPTLLTEIWNLPKDEWIIVNFNNRWQPIGKEGRVLASFLGIMARNANLTPLHIQDWRAFPRKENKRLFKLVEKHSKKNRENRSKQKMPHIAGSKSFACLMAEKAKDGVKPSQAHIFIETHKPRKDRRPIDEESIQNINSMKQKMKKLSNSIEYDNKRVAWEGDIFSQVIGLERHGQVHGLGLGPTPTSLWAPSTSN